MDGQNTALIAQTLAAASQLAAGQPVSAGTVVPVASAILAATGNAVAATSPQAQLAIALAAAAIDAHTQITSAQTSGQLGDAWAALQNRITAAQAAWDAAGQG